MPLSDSQVKAEQAGPRRRNVSVGDSLFLVIESASRGGGKSFEGGMRFPPGRQGKQVPVRIGVYGRGVGKWSLKEARDEWDRIRSWSKQNGKAQGPQSPGEASSDSARLRTNPPASVRVVSRFCHLQGRAEGIPEPAPKSSPPLLRVREGA